MRIAARCRMTHYHSEIASRCVFFRGERVRLCAWFAPRTVHTAPPLFQAGCTPLWTVHTDYAPRI